MGKTVRSGTDASDPGSPAQLQHFAEVAEAVAATTRKLEKAALLGEYFKQLDDVDLSRAARYFSGHQFPLNDSRTTNVGGSIIGEALSQAALARDVDRADAPGELLRPWHVLQSAPGWAEAEQTYAKESDGYRTELNRLQASLDSAAQEFERQAVLLGAVPLRARQ